MTFHEAINEAKSLEEVKIIANQFFASIQKNLDWSDNELSLCINSIANTVEPSKRSQFLTEQIMWHRNYVDFYLRILNMEYKPRS